MLVVLLTLSTGLILGKIAALICAKYSSDGLSTLNPENHSVPNNTCDESHGGRAVVVTVLVLVVV